MANNKRILVIEDDPYIAGLLKMFLEDEGYEVRIYNNARSALDILSNETFNLITLDLGLPGMDGNQFLQELKKINRQLPVIVISANVQRLVRTEMVKAVVPKPFDLDDLTRVVTALQSAS